MLSVSPMKLMNFNHPFFYFLLAVVSAVVAAFINVTNEKKHDSRWKWVGTAISPFLVIFCAWAFWQAQERVSQRWNSQVVFTATTDRDTNLVLKNLGQVAIEDIRIYATVYKLKAVVDNRNHLLIKGLQDFSKISGPLKIFPLLAAGQTEKLSLSEFANILPFFDFEDVIRSPNVAHPAATQAYCFRLTLRNAITKRRHSYYVVTAPWKGTRLPSMVDPGEDASIGGPVDMKWFELRANVRKHQAELFDEVDDHLFRDRELR